MKSTEVMGRRRVQMMIGYIFLDDKSWGKTWEFFSKFQMVLSIARTMRKEFRARLHVPSTSTFFVVLRKGFSAVLGLNVTEVLSLRRGII